MSSVSARQIRGVRAAGRTHQEVDDCTEDERLDDVERDVDDDHRNGLCGRVVEAERSVLDHERATVNDGRDLSE